MLWRYSFVLSDPGKATVKVVPCGPPSRKLSRLLNDHCPFLLEVEKIRVLYRWTSVPNLRPCASVCATTSPETWNVLAPFRDGKKFVGPNAAIPGMLIWPNCGASATKYKERGIAIEERLSELSTGRVKPKRTEETSRGLKTWLSTRVKNCRRV